MSDQPHWLEKMGDAMLARVKSRPACVRMLAALEPELSGPASEDMAYIAKRLKEKLATFPPEQQWQDRE